jgi:glutathione S-transferase
MALAEKGEKAELVTLDLLQGEHKSARHLERHPFGVVPVLEDCGFVLFESRPILRYIDARFPAPAPRLTPIPAPDVARMDQWLSVDQSYIAPHTHALAVERILKKHAGVKPDLSVEIAAEKALTVAFTVIDRSLGGPYLAGETFSLADISLMSYVASLPMLGAEQAIAGLERLGGWWARVRKRGSWQTVVGEGR